MWQQQQQRQRLELAWSVLLAAVQLRGDLDVGELDPLEVDRLALDAGVRTVDEAGENVADCGKPGQLLRDFADLS